MERAGIHPKRGHFTMTDAVIQVGHHDCMHLEQITRILTAGNAKTVNCTWYMVIRLPRITMYCLLNPYFFLC